MSASRELARKPGTAPSSVNRPKPHDYMVKGDGVLDIIAKAWPVPVPPITHPLGENLTQPDPRCMLFDDTHVAMPMHVFNRLSNYSISLPTGVYQGKMWRRYESPKWYLGWYGDHDDPTRCTINWREIIVTDE